jgi:hypothetical protein
LISPEVGGQMKGNFNLGPRYLHDSEASKRFLDDLKYDSKITDFSNASFHFLGFHFHL